MTKRALCIGINDYPGTGSDLSGCVNDAQDWAGMLQGRGFEVTTMLDKDATKAKMASAMTELVKGAGYGDLAVITYSGHGTWVPDQDGDEADQRDEALCPYDINRGNFLVDDELYDIFQQRQRGARVVFISDSCHSGTVSRMAPAIGDNPVRVRFLPPETFLAPKALEVARHIPRAFAGRSRANAAMLFSGCQDWEFSYDASFDGRAERGVHLRGAAGARRSSGRCHVPRLVPQDPRDAADAELPPDPERPGHDQHEGLAGPRGGPVVLARNLAQLERAGVRGRAAALKAQAPVSVPVGAKRSVGDALARAVGGRGPDHRLPEGPVRGATSFTAFLAVPTGSYVRRSPAGVRSSDGKNQAFGSRAEILDAIVEGATLKRRSAEQI